MRVILKTIAVGALFSSCATIPSGYKRIGRTDICIRSDLADEERGLGTVIPFFSAAQIDTITMPAKLVNADRDLNITVYYSMRSSIGSLKGATLDQALGLYKTEDGQERRFSDSIDTPSFRYICNRSLTDGIERCERFANIGQWTYSSSFVDVKQWRDHEATVKTIFDKKLIQLCEPIKK